jgi:hypothetical protein
VRAFGIVSLGLMALVGVSVGFRLLALGRRTRRQPELLIGLGLLLAAVVGAPLAALGRAPGIALTPLGDLVFACGIAATQFGIALLGAFTWLAFRRDELWATLLFVTLAGALGAEWLGIVSASASGDTLAQVLPRTRPWGIAIVASLAAIFAWSGGESLAHYLRLRRRARIGLGEPVVANRMLLWAIAGFATVVLCGAIAGCMLAGLPPLRHPLPLAAIALTSLCASACWALAFLSPATYLARLRVTNGRA